MRTCISTLIDLIYGQVTIKLVQADDARVLVERPANGDWLKVREEANLNDFALPKFAFRITGRNGALQVRDVVEKTSVHVASIDFDLSHYQDSPELITNITGLLNGAAEKRFKGGARFASLSDFDVRMQCGEITSEDVNAFLSPDQQIVQQGKVIPSARITSFSKNTMVIQLESKFQDLFFKSAPGIFKAATGSVGRPGEL